MNSTGTFKDATENEGLTNSIVEWQQNYLSQLVNPNMDLLKEFFLGAFQQSTNSNCDDDEEPLDLSCKSSQSSIPSETNSDEHNSNIEQIVSDNCTDITLPIYRWKTKSFDFHYYFENFVIRYTANDVCYAHCQYLYKDHYHCQLQGCRLNNADDSHVIQGKEKLRLHGQWHEVAREITDIDFIKCQAGTHCSVVGSEHRCNSKHAHCRYNKCLFISYLVDEDEDILNMQCLAHIQQKHYKIILKRTSNNNQVSKRLYSNSAYYIENKKKQDFETFSSPWLTQSVPDTPSPPSSASSSSSPNQTSALIAANFFMSNDSAQQGNQKCNRIFCNLKRFDHYHCPICFVGCGKVDLFIRHIKRHRY